MVKKGIERLYLIIIFLFLYLPIAVLIVLSFNDSKSRVQWGGFTLRWYQRLFEDRYILEALLNTLIIAVVSAFAWNTGSYWYPQYEKKTESTDAWSYQYPAFKCGHCNRYLVNAVTDKIYKTWHEHRFDRTYYF